MKKLVLFAAIVAAVGFSACKKAATEETTPVTNDVTVVQETPAEGGIVAEGDSTNVVESMEVAE